MSDRKLPPDVFLPGNVDRSLGQAIKDLYRILARRIKNEIQSGVIAEIPISDGSDRFFWASDEQILYFDTAIGWVPIGGGGAQPGVPDFWVVETPAGVMDSANDEFLLTYIPRDADYPTDGSRQVIVLDVNNVILEQGVDFELSGGTITLTTPPDSGDIMQARYIADVEQELIVMNNGTTIVTDSIGVFLVK